MEGSTHIKGLLLTFTAVLILSPDALLTRSVGADVWTLLFWRCLLTACMQTLFLSLYYRRRLLQSFRNIGRTGLLSAAIVTLGSLLFVNSLMYTTAANTLVILAAAPMFSALLSGLVLKEPLATRTRLAICTCFAGILLIFSGSFGAGLLLGDLLALGATLMWGGNLVVLRSGKEVNMIPASLLGNLLVVPVAWLAGAAPFSTTSHDMLLLALLGAILLPASFTMITIAPRYLPAAEISLILLCETVLGPIWVWLALGEVPQPQTVLAGALIVGTLAVHTALALRQALRRAGGTTPPSQR
jgi:drug/metabolite transporter (DMT)-like permease